jgi:hypothetical protein
MLTEYEGLSKIFRIDHEINNNNDNNKLLLRSNTTGYGSKTH